MTGPVRTVTHLQKLVMLLQVFVLEARPDLQKKVRDEKRYTLTLIFTHTHLPSWSDFSELQNTHSTCIFPSSVGRSSEEHLRG